MKRQQVASLIALSVAAGAILAVGSQPAQASEQRFSCGQSGGTPATMAKTKRGYVPVIRWTSDYFGSSGWSPQARCTEVSNRFEAYHRNGTLKFLTTGRMNRQSVVCVASQDGGPCSGLLFTLKPGSNPGRTLQRLLDVRYRATGPLNESAARVYINMEDFLDKAPVEKTAPAEPVTPEISNPPQSKIDPAKLQSSPTATTPLGLW
ncbi:COP23 domain-containing protein [Acaryochloris sp. IP29b_bin.148]|uniref:COP23 domain-containing protein n=1 Tax=Acaryochloris sp. IP29b_bin.148 TaxID=2969218 RepID=UPI0026125A8F|nr:COP23 domain-containing protein [Acaryochloris sp. IP29b_bin.148]